MIRQFIGCLFRLVPQTTRVKFPKTDLSLRMVSAKLAVNLKAKEFYTTLQTKYFATGQLH
jgi:hypothetical protein